MSLCKRTAATCCRKPCVTGTPSNLYWKNWTHFTANRAGQDRPIIKSINNESESLPRRNLSLAWRPRLRELLRAVSWREKMVMGNLLAGRRDFCVDYLPVDIGFADDERRG